VTTPTYTSIASLTVGAPVSSVTFGSIPSTYRDLICVIEAASTSGTGLEISVNLNSDFGANYQRVQLSGSGLTTSSTGIIGQSAARLFPYGTTASIYSVDFIDASETNKHKQILARCGNSATQTSAITSRWLNNSRITSIMFASSANNFATGSTFNLYGVIS
jgi:hypothetical protein